MPYKDPEEQKDYLSAYQRYKSVVYRAERGSWREILVEALGGKCKGCGATEPLELDHIVPLQFGGKHELANIQVLCVACHKTKTGDDRARPGRHPRDGQVCRCGLSFSSKKELTEHILRDHPYWLKDY